jgi:predicted nucleic acid-binding protein
VVDVWVCNSSPLIALARIQRLDLIESLADDVLVSATVLREIEAGAGRDGAAQAIRNSPRLRIRPDVEIPEAVRSWQLDPGESQVLAMALQCPGCGAVIDDRAARSCAASFSIPMIGTVGLVALARQRGTLKAAAPVYKALRDAGLFVSPALLKAVLAQFGEEIE